MTLFSRAVFSLAFAIYSCNAFAVSAGQRSGNGLLSFIERNDGQAHEAYSHVALVPAYTALLSADDALFMVPVHELNREIDQEAKNGQPDGIASVAMQMQLLGASEHAAMTHSGLLAGRSNYLRDADPDTWITGIAHYQRLRYANVYPGIDLVYTLQNDAVRYDFIVSPQADPADFQLGFAGAFDVNIAPDGALRVRSETAELRHSAPVIYQEIDGQTRPVDGVFIAMDDGSLRFQVAAHNADSELVIDPQVVFSTLLGGSGSDGGQDIAVDASGRMIIVGDTASLDFPLADQSPPGLAGSTDIFVARLSADGQTLEFATYIGGSAEDNPHQVEIDADGSMVIAGYTSSPDFPVVNAAQPDFMGSGSFDYDAFVTKLAADGASLIYSTYLGGSEPTALVGGSEWIRSLVLDDQGNAFVAGETPAADFPSTQTLNGRDCLDGEAGSIFLFFGDAFVAKFSPTGALEFAVCFGDAERDTGRGIALGPDGTLHVVGFTISNDFPVTPGAFQTARAGPCYAGHVTYLSADGASILSSTLVGGSAGCDYAQQVRIAADGSRVVIGSSNSDDFPTTPGSIQPRRRSPLIDDNATLYRVSADSSRLVFSTYLGGSEGDYGWGLELGTSGQIYLSGYTSSPDFPLKDARQSNLGGAASLSASIGEAADETQALAFEQEFIDNRLLGTLVAGNAGINRLYKFDDSSVLEATYNITEDVDDTHGVVIADTDFDGALDVMVAANNGTPSKVYRIDSPGSFTCWASCREGRRLPGL